MLFLVIQLFFLKTGFTITQSMNFRSSNQQWLVHWVTLLHNKKHQHFLVDSHCRPRRMNSKKKHYCKKAGVKIGGLWYDFMPSGMIFSPVEFCKLLAATCLRFLVVCGCNWNWTGTKNHTTAGIIFCLKNTCAQIWQQGPGRADRQGDVFRSSFLSRLDLTTLPKGGGGEGGCQVVV